MIILIPIFSDAFLHPLHKDNNLSLLYTRHVSDKEGKIICINHPDCNDKITKQDPIPILKPGVDVAQGLIEKNMVSYYKIPVLYEIKGKFFELCVRVDNLL